MYELIVDELGQLFEAGKSFDRKKRAALLQQIQDKLVATDPLELVCTVAEYCEEKDTYKMAVHRMIKSGELPSRKSGGVLLVRL